MQTTVVQPAQSQPAMQCVASCPDIATFNPSLAEGRDIGVWERRFLWVAWIGAAIAALVWALVEDAGWDAKCYWKAMQDLRHGIDPYAAGVAAARAWIQGMPDLLTYNYPPLTLLPLRLCLRLPVLVLCLGIIVANVAGVLLQLWAGYQMAGKSERRWLLLLLPAIPFFPGLANDNVLLSGNVSIVLYGFVLAAAVTGWQRGRWGWYYLAVLLASCFKVPSLMFLAFPLLMDRRQWLPSGLTAAVAGMVFASNMWFWPLQFHEHLQTMKLLLERRYELGLGPAGIVGSYLADRGMALSPAITLVYGMFALALGGGLAILAGRVQKRGVAPERWVPVALLGVMLLNPRIKKYDLFAMTIPLLLLLWRGLRAWMKNSRPRTGWRRVVQTPVMAGMALFLTNNLIGGWYADPLQMLILVGGVGLGMWEIVRKAPVCDELL